LPPKPKRPCNKPGCPNLTTDTYCKEHQVVEDRQRAEAHRYYDQHQRDKKTAAFYNSPEWRTTRQAVLVRDNGLCQECLQDKRIAPADTVHHKIELKQDWNKRLQLDNLVSLCAKCHNRIHAKG